MLEISKAQTICDTISEQVGLGIIFAFQDGEILAASDRSRLGDRHAIAAKIMARALDDRAVTAEEAALSTGMREGYNVGIDVDGERIASIGVSGPVAVAKQMGRLASLWAHSMVEADLARSQREREIRELARQIQSELGAAVEQMSAELIACRQALSDGRVASETSRHKANDAADAVTRSSSVSEEALQSITTLAERTSEMDQRVTGAARTVATAENENTSAQSAVKSFGDAADQISKAVKVIGDVAMRTRLLSLNAAVEAARAGEAGRGFAVVAQEVRSLSEATSGSTKSIETDVKAVQTRSNEVFGALKQIAGSIEQLGDANRHLVEGFSAQSIVIEQTSTHVRGVAAETKATFTAMQATSDAADQTLAAVASAEAAANRAADVTDDVSTRLDRLVGRLTEAAGPAR